MKIVFSTICGVLNNTGYIIREGKRGEVSANAIDPECVRNLSTLCAAAPARVVLTSSWRHALNLDQFCKLLAMKGFTGKVIGITPAAPSGKLQDDIQLWLDTYTQTDPDEDSEPGENAAVEGFCVLDPRADVGSLKPFLVQTSFDTGLTAKDVYRGLRVLSS